MPQIHSPLAAPLGLALAAVLGLQACRTPPAAEVIAADGVLCDLAQRLAAGELRVRCLLQPGEDPHQFRLTPQQSRELSQAQLVLINGYGLTPALAALGKPGTASARTVAVAELAVPNSPALDAGAPKTADRDAHHEGDTHHEDSHTHGDRDPHVWHDPQQAAALVTEVAQQLSQLKPAARERITARAEAMTATLQQLDTWNRRQLATIPTASPLATGHRAFASAPRHSRPWWSNCGASGCRCCSPNSCRRAKRWSASAASAACPSPLRLWCPMVSRRSQAATAT